ncbi:MAG TPA: TonB-dependent receptor [Candidatus Binatia bacterium]|nr:TonB-dependent receptor [Candidatus Binatia bacterium]
MRSSRAVLFPVLVALIVSVALPLVAEAQTSSTTTTTTTTKKKTRKTTPAPAAADPVSEPVEPTPGPAKETDTQKPGYAPGPASKADTTELETMEVTGSRLRRVDAETALPVTVLGRDEISRSGVQDLEQLVTYISSTATAGATKGSDLAGLATYGQSSVSLRGLGDQRTLVLLNGRRLAVFAGTGGGVDINEIPLAAIDRVEVLRDGASTAYGTDAVAGVINFITRKDYNGAGVFYDYGFPTRGDGGKMHRLSVVLGQAGSADGKVNFMLTGSMEKGQAVFANRRNFSASGNRLPYFSNAATPSGRIEGVWIPGQDAATNAADPSGFGYASSGYGNPNALSPGLPPPFDTDRCADIGMFEVTNADGTPRPGGVGSAYYNCNFDSAPFVGLFPKTERYNALGTFHAQITPDVAYYAEMAYSRNRLTEAYQPSPVRVGFLATDLAFEGSGVDPAILIQPTNVNYPTAYLNAIGAPTDRPYAVSLRTFLTGPRTEEDTNTQVRFINGIQGNFSFAPDWGYDFSAMYNQNQTSGRVINGYFSQLSLASILNCQPTCTTPEQQEIRDTWNPWAPGGVQPPAVTAALEASKYKGPTVSGDSRLAGLEGNVTTSLFPLPGGTSQLAIGGTARREYYKIDVPAILGSGDIAGLGGATVPVDASRTVAAVYSELNLPVVQALEVNASGRYDHYNDVGGTLNGKLSTRFQPIRQVLVRGAVGTGFRAPSLVELYNPQTLGTTEQFVDPNLPGDGLIQANAVIGGNPSLEPERSRQASLGMVLSPVTQFSMGADYFFIRIDKYITAPSALALVTAEEAGTPIYGPDDVVFVDDTDTTSGVDTVNQTLRNAAVAYVSGVDTFLNYKQPIGFGDIGIDFQGTYTDRFDLKTLAGTQHSVGTIVDQQGVPLDVAGLGVIPRWKHTAALNWMVGPVTTTFAQNFYSSYRDADYESTPGNGRHDVPSQSIYDAQVALKVPAAANQFEFAVGARNIFNKDPPIFIGNGASFQYGYDPTMYDPRARFVYFKIGYSFLR